MTTVKPWLSLYNDMPAEIQAPDTTFYEMLVNSAKKWPDTTAIIYMGKRLTYADLKAEVDKCAAAFMAHGIQTGDSVVLSLPNVPNVVIGFYALNKIGATAAMTHPLSSPEELKHYITQTESKWAVTVDMFYPVFRDLAEETGLEKVVIARFSDYLSRPMKVGFAVTKGRKIPSVPSNDPLIINWKDFLAVGTSALETLGKEVYSRPIEPNDACVVLFSGGTTNLPKGIELSSANFNSLGVSMGYISGITHNDSVLAILPAFHGFGLGLCIHTALCVGAHFILVPEFSADIYTKNVLKHQPSFIAGVPTLFQALLGNAKFRKAPLDCLKGAYCGGDMLSPDLKKRFDEAIAAQGSKVELLEGYGLTECVTACALSPRNAYRNESMGIPIPGLTLKIADTDTGVELPIGTEGEICVSGVTVMKGYLKDPEATASTLRVHADGQTWLHTGDIGKMDEDGYFYFMGRMKRLIKVSGVSVYPLQVEQVLESHPLVNRACVIGLPDEYQMSSLKGFVLLGDGTTGNDDIRQELITYCKKHLIKWAVPREIEFRTELPTTRVGKIAYTELEHEELTKAEEELAA
ncbi:MAG: AMP-binding protein [Propionibacteriaceae bacterium]|jgi:long-chain acyl-CoA synthetase|nr:AMP-binding protein [Propionibacteriaceae bacterium]